MIDAIDYRTIVEAVNEGFESQSLRVMMYDSVEPAARNAMAEINAKTRKHSMVAVLFCNPKTGFCKNEILSSLGYLHHRSKESINLFCCGYGAYWPVEKYPDRSPIVKIDGEQWYYSDEAFVGAIEDFEGKTKWRYSGENELLVMDVSPSDSANNLHINSTIVCNLEKMKNDNAFTSVRSFFESLIRYCASTDSADAWTFSDMQGAEVGKSVLKETIIKLLPKPLQSVYRESESYAIKQI